MLFFTDWLGLSLRLPEDVGTPRAGYIWQEYSCTNVWEKRRVLYTDDGQRVLTLLSKPRSSVIDERAALVEFENEWLYHGITPDRILDVLLDSCNFEVLGMSRLDLCVDFCPTKRQMHIIEGLATGKYYVTGKRTGSLFWSTNNSPWLHPMWNGRRIPHCISWGHKTSAVRWKLYYKTKELADDMGGACLGKPYIVDKWRQNNMDVSNVWRLEVSLHNCNQQEYKGQRLTYSLYKDYNADIFTAYFSTRFTIRRNEGHADKSNDRVVEFLPIEGLKNTVRYSRAEALAERSPRITLLRHLVASLEEPAVLLDDTSRENCLWHIEQMVERDGLQNYFNMMTGRWLEDFIEEKRCEAVDIKNGGVK